ncbi:MAG: Dabb family protein [bacterium]|nr:Dabb family protein [bacterium]
MLTGGCLSLNIATSGDGELGAQEPVQVLRHVVLMKFKEGTAPEDIRKAENGFRALASKMDLIHDFEWGTEVGPGAKAQGFTHGFVVTFLSVQDRDAYGPHPAHQEYVALLKPILEDVLVFDYWAGR